jgi:sugar (pentulose or hexulose) kinase
VINLDQDQQPLRPAIVWLDQRRTEGCPPVGGLWGLLFKLAGMQDTVRYFQAEAEANWIKTHQPEIWKKTDKYVLLSGYLTHKLTGKVIDSVGCQVAYIPFDYKNQDWAKPSDWKWQAVKLNRRCCLIWFNPPSFWGTSHQGSSSGNRHPRRFAVDRHSGRQSHRDHRCGLS